MQAQSLGAVWGSHNQGVCIQIDRRYLSGGKEVQLRKKLQQFNFTEDESSHSVFFLRRGIFFSEDGLYRVNPQEKGS